MSRSYTPCSFPRASSPRALSISKLRNCSQHFYSFFCHFQANRACSVCSHNNCKTMRLNQLPHRAFKHYLPIEKKEDAGSCAYQGSTSALILEVFCLIKPLIAEAGVVFFCGGWKGLSCISAKKIEWNWILLGHMQENGTFCSAVLMKDEDLTGGQRRSASWWWTG